VLGSTLVSVRNEVIGRVIEPNSEGRIVLRPVESNLDKGVVEGALEVGAFGINVAVKSIA
jgi:hypothetical protein